MHILLVEDHLDSQKALEHFLAHNGFEVTCAATLKESLRLLETHSFNAIVSDIALPDGTGYALMSEARRRGLKTLGIAFSAYAFPDDVEESKLTGFDHHLTKPVDHPRLLALLKMSTDGPASV